MYLHHPGQFLKKKSEVLHLDLLSVDYFSSFISNYAHDIEITQLETMRNRKNANEPCDSTMDTNYDKFLIKGAVDFLKCIPPFWKEYYEWQNSTFSTCKTSKDLKLANQLDKNVTMRSQIAARYQKPCAEMSFGILKNEFEDNIRKKPEGIESEQEASKVLGSESASGYGYLSIKIKYPDDRYHEIVNIQQVTFDSFWSSTGGFIGMFLGYSVMQVPDFIFGIVSWSIKRKN